MRVKWGGIGVLGATVASAGAAGAADLAVKAPVYTKAPPMFVSDWAGFYIGVHGGGGWADTTWENAGPRLNGNLSGGLVGGHIGYNWQYGSVVVGSELDFDIADVKLTQTFASNGFGDTQKTNELASARGRLGYIALPNLLAYGTVGAGWGHFKFNDHHGPGGNPPDFGATSQFGWVAGAGIE
jgi:opacity protein-like surface antigen